MSGPPGVEQPLIDAPDGTNGKAGLLHHRIFPRILLISKSRQHALSTLLMHDVPVQVKLATVSVKLVKDRTRLSPTAFVSSTVDRERLTEGVAYLKADMQNEILIHNNALVSARNCGENMIRITSAFSAVRI
ncbi:hypothetical protein AJ80_08336 [Polytolypa hystricis UAMH7299]|uniref:Uncharacterized protein n=1 Tax=Polytolypa hystricis (strain UAMH7299) TaxID=1447883 RepID=A0A2B7X974_POLH7|nr:hypothetical protein AJ80_08336 [Polytolypa hystricis UAMH7299]